MLLAQTEAAAVKQMNIELEETVAKNRPGPCIIKLARLTDTRVHFGKQVGLVAKVAAAIEKCYYRSENELQAMRMRYGKEIAGLRGAVRARSCHLGVLTCDC